MARGYIDERIREYVLPIRVVAKSDTVTCEDVLLKGNCKQISIGRNDDYCLCNGRGYVVLDFGKELFGGLRLMVRDNAQDSTIKACKPNVHIRFGESVSETMSEIGENNATNDHSPRDMWVFIPMLSDTEWGSTGFRFARIDFFAEAEIKICNIYAISIYRQEQAQATFKCDDEVLNKIFDVSAYTVKLNMQQLLWDGIKRDQLVWVGDLHPEVMAISYLYGKHSIIDDSVEHIAQSFSFPTWYNDIPTYSLWFVQILLDYSFITENSQIFEKNKNAIKTIITQVEQSVTSDGALDFTKVNAPLMMNDFLDWASYGSEDARAGTHYLCLYTLKNLFACELTDSDLKIRLKAIIDKLSAKRYEIKKFKQVAAFKALALNETSNSPLADFLCDGGAAGLSTFMSYYILKATSNLGKTQNALENMRQYYGGMLQLGATSFWEDFDIEWLKNALPIDTLPDGKRVDVHKEKGNFCYKGFRHSLCHGWSCGSIQFIIEEILGLKILKSGYREITLKPNLCGLKFIEVNLPTPYGDLQIKITDNNNKPNVYIKKPQQIKVVN